MLAGNLDLAQTPEIRLVVCGGASLIATHIVSRATKETDIDVSDGYRMLLQELLKNLGYESIAARL